MARRLALTLAFLLIASLAVVPASVGAQTAATGGQVRGNAARTGEQPGPGLTGSPALRWSYSIGDPDNQFYTIPPVMAGDTIHVVARTEHGPQLRRLDAKTGRALPWQGSQQTGLALGDADVFPLAYADGLLYVPTIVHTQGAIDRAELTAYDPATGAKSWRFEGYSVDPAVVPQPESGIPQPSDYIFSPAIADGTVYVAVSGVTAKNPRAHNSAGMLVALDARSGKVIWHTETGGLTGTPSVADGIVFDGVMTDPNGSDSFTLAFDAKTGKQLWRAHVESVGQMPVVDGLVYTTTNTQIVALNAATGAVAWRVTAPAGDLSAAAVAAGVVYVSDLPSQSQDGNATANQEPVRALYALDAKTGKLRWSAGFKGQALGGLAIADGIVYVPTDYPDQKSAPPPVIDQTASLLAFDGATGKLLWSFTPSHVGDRYSEPMIAGGVAYIVTKVYVDAIGSGLTNDSPRTTPAATSLGRGSTGRG